MTSTIAIIADIHANLEALTEVLSDISAQNVSQVYCLGDIVGYGPNPCECVDIAMTFSVCIMGNHDKLASEGAVDDPFVLWTRRQLSNAILDNDDADRRRCFLRNLPLTHREDGFLFLHGSPRDPLNEYMFPEYIFDQRKMEAIFALVDKCCFMGHTHLPGVFTPDRKFLTPEETDDEWHIGPGKKAMCNVGSVGQPRDDDNRACYCLCDGKTIRFRRVDYDMDTTARKIADLFPPQ